MLAKRPNPPNYSNDSARCRMLRGSGCRVRRQIVHMCVIYLRVIVDLPDSRNRRLRQNRFCDRRKGRAKRNCAYRHCNSAKAAKKLAGRVSVRGLP